MSLEGTGLNATTTLGADIIGTPATFTLAGPLSNAWPTSGLIHVNISDTEELAGTISGTTVTITKRAVEAIGSFNTAQNHTAGDSVKLIFSYAAAKNMFVTKLDEQGGAVASVTFSSISQDYRDLEIEWRARADNAVNNNDLYVQFNGDTAGNYEYQRSYITGTAAATNDQGQAQTQMLGGFVPGTSATANYFSGGVIRIQNYTSTAMDKEIQCQSSLKISNAAAGLYIFHSSGGWRTTGSAITSILLKQSAGNFVAGTIFTLRGKP